MARTKYYDAASASWKYADAAFSNTLVAGDNIKIENNIISAEFDDKTKQDIANIIKNEYEAELLAILGGDSDVTE